MITEHLSDTVQQWGNMRPFYGVKDITFIVSSPLSAGEK